MRIYANEQLGPKQRLTPEGYLLCEDVPIARTGSQLYAAHELPFLEAGPDGLITVIREEADVFRPETIASFEGKSVTIGHAFVDPDNWQKLTTGTAQNVRRGVADQYDLLLADLLITEANAIGEVRTPVDVDGLPIPGEKPLREVSCGYDADYVQERPGVAYQRNIVGNHVALVERGRAGPRCSIQDGEIEMSTPKTPATLLQRLLKAVRTGDASLMKRTADEAETEMEKEKKDTEDEEAAAEKKETADQIATLTKTVDVLTKAVAALVKGKTTDEDEGDDEAKKKKAEDDAAELEKEKKETADALPDTVVRAEILAPGFSMPAVTTRDSLAAARRTILAEAMKTEDGKKLLAPLLQGRTVDSLDNNGAATIFLAGSEMARARNNSRGIRSSINTNDSVAKPASIADINKRNAEFWAKQS